MLTSTVPYKGNSYEVEISACSLQMDGEFAGNLDIAIDVDKALDWDVVVKELTYSGGRSEGPMQVVGYAQTSRGYDVTLTHGSENAVDALRFYWQGEAIGTEKLTQIHVADYDESDRFEPKPKQGCGSAILLLGIGICAASAVFIRG